MVVCKFFQEGYCRYGQNCRFEHIYGSKYSYHANPQPQHQQQPQQPQQQTSTGVTDEQLVQQVHNDVQSALKGGQWLLSCYAPFKKPNFPGLTDLSPEEARLFIYEAKANNTVEQAVTYMNNLITDSRSKYEQLLTTSPNTTNALRSLYKGETPTSPFTSGQLQNVFGQSQSNASSVFRSAVQNTPAAQTTSPFATQNTAVQNTSAFGAQNSNSVFNQSPAFGQPDTAKSLFSQASQNIFGSQSPNQNSIFGGQDAAKSIFAQANTPVDPAKSIFAQAANATRSPFESASQPAQPFKSPFDQPSPFAQNTNNMFQRTNAPANVFGQAANVFQQTPSDDPAVYSNMNDLAAEDLEMFKADSFKLGFIPEVPPPHSLCV